ncbi:MAG: SAF domain-containing protein [Nocardioides sp.]
MTSPLGNSGPLGRAARRLRRRVLAHRRLLGGLCALLAVVLALQAARPAEPASASLTIARRDLPAGTRLGPDDLASVRVPPDAVPVGAAAGPDLAGRVLASAVRRGEPVTDLRLVGPALTAGRPGLVAVPVRLPDPEMAALLRVGDHIRLLATDAASGTTRVVAPDAEVLALPGPLPTRGTATASGNGVTDGLSGRLIVAGVPEDLVTPVTSASVRDFLTYAYPH